MFLMKLWLSLVVEDLAFQFKVSPGKVSQIFITWVKFRNIKRTCSFSYLALFSTSEIN